MESSACVPTAASGGDTATALLQRAWALCYIDPKTNLGVAEQLTLLGEAEAPSVAWGWWHLALANLRLSELQRAAQALVHARQAFGALDHALDHAVGLALCDELEGIGCRIGGDLVAAERLMVQCEARGEQGYDAVQHFLVHNSRSMLCRKLGRMDESLRHLLLAQAHAEASANRGAMLTALINLGGVQQDLHNMEDACRISEQALVTARLHGVPRDIALVAHNLTVVYNAMGQAERAYEMARELRALIEQDASGYLVRYAEGAALGHLATGHLDDAEALLEHGLRHVDRDAATFHAWLGARCALKRGQAAKARSIGEARLGEIDAQGVAEFPYDLMELHRVLSDACEALGDVSAALSSLHHAHRLYQELVGRSARARRVTLEVGFDLARTQRERDSALEMQRRAEADRVRLTELNQALRGQIEANEVLQQRLLDQALRDALTGLHNRRYLFETAPAMLELARRQRSPLCVVLLDLDHFKQFNDTHGHQAGDRLLRAFSQRARAMLRRSDLFSRYGGEEFVAVMPDTPPKGALVVLGRLLEACSAEPFVDGLAGPPLTTFSAGVAVFPGHADSLDHLLQRADVALYAAKRQGRARVEIACSGAPDAPG